MGDRKVKGLGKLQQGRSGIDATVFCHRYSIGALAELYIYVTVHCSLTN